MIKSIFWKIFSIRYLWLGFSEKSYFSYLHKLAIKKQNQFIAENYFFSKEVISGPFQGLKYPGLKSSGSSLLPKLSGTYEKEISDELAGLLRSDYSEIIDIGCAEGYYAVGLALKKPMALVYAFDLNAEARRRCLEMGKLNKVDDRLTIFEKCDANALKNIRIRSRALIVSDCEGFEMELFTPELVAEFLESDFIIETHDCFNPETSKKLKTIFSQTHTIKSIFSISDELKSKSYPIHLEIPKMYHFDLFSEERVGVTEWLICLSKNKLN